MKRWATRSSTEFNTELSLFFMELVSSAQFRWAFYKNYLFLSLSQFRELCERYNFLVVSDYVWNNHFFSRLFEDVGEVSLNQLKAMVAKCEPYIKTDGALDRLVLIAESWGFDVSTSKELTNPKFEMLFVFKIYSYLV